MKLFEPEGKFAWIGMTLPEEKLFANAVMSYLSGVNFDSPYMDSILGVRASGAILIASDFVELIEVLSETTVGIPDIEWDDTCEDDLSQDEVQLALERSWVWKNVWDKWTRDELDEFPGNDWLFLNDTERFATHELEKARKVETRWWKAFKKHLDEGTDESVAQELANDESPRAEQVLPRCLKEEASEIESQVIQEVGL